jgi:hypothetical protein
MLSIRFYFLTSPIFGAFPLRHKNSLLSQIDSKIQNSKILQQWESANQKKPAMDPQATDGVKRKKAVMMSVFPSIFKRGSNNLTGYGHAGCRFRVL